MNPKSLFESPMFRIIALFSLLLIVAFSGAGSSAMEGGIDRVDFLVTDCTSYLLMTLVGDYRGTNDDRNTADIMALVVYDYFGNVILFYPRLQIVVGASLGGINIGRPLDSIPAARPFTATFFDTNSMDASLGEAEGFPELDSISVDPADFGMCLDLPLNPVIPDPVTDEDEIIENPSFSDGRINNFDMAAPVAAYGHDFETGRGVVVYSPEGALLLEVHPEAIASVEDCPAENTLILSSGDVALYRLSSCLYQLNAPSLDGTKTYVLIFDSLYTPAYISYEE